MPLRIGLVGYGYWGPNLARNFSTSKSFDLVRISDLSDSGRSRASRANPHAEIVARDITADDDLDAIAIATPVSTHFGLANSALRSGKHVWLEKPMTSSVEESRQLVELAGSKGLTLLVDHTFLFTGAVQKIKQLIDHGELGDLFYYDSVRINLGLFQHDVNVVWDLAPHDFSIIEFVTGRTPVAVSAHGRGHFGTGMEDVAYVTLFYDDDFLAHLHLNWLSPVKIRRTVIGGTKRMLVWDDLNREEQIKVYDKGMSVESPEGRHQVLATPRQGEMHAPVVPMTEALQLEVSHFAEAIKSGQQPINDGRAGLNVVSLLEASNRSLEEDGRTIELKDVKP